jgi:hypothetical protein
VNDRSKCIRESKPWNGITVPPEIYYPRGMIGHEERRMLYWLSNCYYVGEGLVVDAGAYAGASAFCLAAGMSRSRVSSGPLSRVMSYDLFKAVDQYVARAISNDFHKISVGDSYLDVFKYQTALYANIVDIFAGDFLEAPVPGAQIEILFVDVAKSPNLNQHVATQYISRLIPGRSILVQQDYYHCWHPYMQITMEALADYFELVDPLVTNQSRMWKLLQLPSAAVLASASKTDMPFDEAVFYLDRAIGRDEGDCREMNKVAKLWYLTWSDHIAEAIAYNETLVPPSGSPTTLWEIQLAAVRAHLIKKVRSGRN